MNFSEGEARPRCLPAASLGPAPSQGSCSRGCSKHHLVWSVHGVNGVTHCAHIPSLWLLLGNTPLSDLPLLLNETAPAPLSPVYRMPQSVSPFSRWLTCLLLPVGAVLTVLLRTPGACVLWMCSSVRLGKGSLCLLICWSWVVSKRQRVHHHCEHNGAVFRLGEWSLMKPLPCYWALRLFPVSFLFCVTRQWESLAGQLCVSLSGSISW